MEVRKRRLNDLIAHELYIQKEIRAAKEDIEHQVILNNVSHFHVIATLPSALVDIINGYAGEKQCFDCHNIYPISIQHCLFCNANQFMDIELRSSIIKIDRNKNVVFFADRKDSDIWNYCLQFANLPNFTSDHKPLQTDVKRIWIGAETFLENGSDCVWVSVKLCDKDLSKVFYEVCKKDLLSDFQKKKFDYPNARV